MSLPNRLPPWGRFTTTASTLGINSNKHLFSPAQLVSQTFARTSTAPEDQHGSLTTADNDKSNFHPAQRHIHSAQGPKDDTDLDSPALGAVEEFQGSHFSFQNARQVQRLPHKTSKIGKYHALDHTSDQGAINDETAASDLEDEPDEALNDLLADFDQDDVVYVPDGSKDVDGRLKSQVGYDHSGNMYQRENENDAWRPASYHHLKRVELAAIANAKGSYDHARRRGEEETDQTCFLASQKTWSTARDYRPDILFQLKRTNRRIPSYEPIPWIFQGRILIDTDNHEIKKWREIPDVIASVYEDLFIEAIERGDERIKHKDFRARMPKVVLKRGKATTAPSPNSITQRLRRARIYACCLSWRKEGRDNGIPAYMISLLPQDCIDTNNTRTFRDLLDYEFAEALLQNLGKHAERARNGRGNDAEKSKIYCETTTARAKDLKEKPSCKKRTFSEAALHYEDQVDGQTSRKKQEMLAPAALPQHDS